MDRTQRYDDDGDPTVDPSPIVSDRAVTAADAGFGSGSASASPDEEVEVARPQETDLGDHPAADLPAEGPWEVFWGRPDPLPDPVAATDAEASFESDTFVERDEPTEPDPGDDAGSDVGLTGF